MFILYDIKYMESHRVFVKKKKAKRKKRQNKIWPKEGEPKKILRKRRHAEDLALEKFTILRELLHSRI